MYDRPKRQWQLVKPHGTTGLVMRCQFCDNHDTMARDVVRYGRVQCRYCLRAGDMDEAREEVKRFPVDQVNA